MDTLKVHSQTITLVDQVEDKLLNYLKEKDIRTGDSIPNELELAAALGVARSVLREPLRLKYVDRQLVSFLQESLVLLGFRIALEIGICSDIFRNITPEDISELEEIVKMGIVFENNEYAPVSEFTFHAKLYEITGNKTISEFQDIIHPVMIFVKNKFKDLLEPINIEMKEQGQIVTHVDLLNFLKNRDELGYRKAIEQHFEVYKRFLY